MQNIFLILFLLFASLGINAQAFITTWQTTEPNQSIYFPTVGTETYDYTVDWGDGNIESGYDGNAYHTYSDSGTYTVKITGIFPRIYFNWINDNALKLASIEQWGDIEWTSMVRAFAGCKNMHLVAADMPNFSNTTDLTYMLASTNAMNEDISHWDMSHIEIMDYLFQSCATFNQDISAWDMSNVKSMKFMFAYTSEFNQDLNDWDVGQVEDMSNMFLSADKFNANIDSWDVGSVKNMHEMFAETKAFNSDISNWDMHNVEDLSGMFRKALAFNQNINDWDVGSATNMFKMFENSIFNQPINDWNVENVVNMAFMFKLSQFDQPLSNWDMSNIITISSMFARSVFTQPLNDWDVSNIQYMNNLFSYAIYNSPLDNWDVGNVTNMKGMFLDHFTFNQNIGNWDVQSVTTMEEMFKYALFINQDFSNWPIRSVTNMRDMFIGATLSTQNYDALLISWNIPLHQNNVPFHAGDSYYCEGEEARQELIDSDNWMITDAGKNCDIPNLPDCSILISPTDGSVDIITNTEIYWEYIEKAIGYNIQIGSTPGATDILDISIQETQYLLHNLPCNSVIYISITPFNANGTALGCIEEEFTTMIETNCNQSNIFSPNHDGINDYFPTLDISTIKQLTIYNRWGQIIHDIANPTRGWNGQHKGQDVPTDSYIYKIIYVDDQVRSGDITVVR